MALVPASRGHTSFLLAALLLRALFLSIAVHCALLLSDPLLNTLVCRTEAGAALLSPDHRLYVLLGMVLAMLDIGRLRPCGQKPDLDAFDLLRLALSQHH